MTTEEILIVAGIVVAVLVVLGVVFWLVSARRRKHRERLRQRYGSEYDATVDAKGRRDGIDDLDHREEERRDLRLREPDEATRADLRQRMADLQFRFVEAPPEVLLEAQRVVVDALRARGYPIAEDRAQALRLLSVDHPEQTPSLRTLLDGRYGRDVGQMRDLFVDARSALLEVLDVSYSQRDVARRPEGERPAPAGGPSRRPEPARQPARPTEPEPAGRDRAEREREPADRAERDRAERDLAERDRAERQRTEGRPSRPEPAPPR